MNALIEVVGVDMRCFKVRADTMEPIGCSYYEPAAWRDPAGQKQMCISEWQRLLADRRDDEIRRYYLGRA